MKTINEQIWVLRNAQGEFFTGYGNFSPNFIEALFYADPDGAKRDRDAYEYADGVVQSVWCVGVNNPKKVEVNK